VIIEVEMTSSLVQRKIQNFTVKRASEKKSVLYFCLCDR